jgi:hypothetical protein
MENKKEYIEPEMKVVNLVHQVQPLCDSHNGEFGLAPHEQDRIA